MLVCTTWKSRPLLPDQTNRMMEAWAKTEAREAENTATERLCWYINTDGSGGVTVSRVSDPDTAAALLLETSLALGEFIEIESKIVLDLDSAMAPITAAVEYVN